MLEREADAVAAAALRGTMDPAWQPSTAPVTALPADLGAGQSLPAALLEWVERRLAADFSCVRLHTDARAHAHARANSARALTYGTHIVMGEGELAGSGGRELILHELVHVLQQSGEVEGPRHRARPRRGARGPPQRKILPRPRLADPIPTYRELETTHTALSSDPTVASESTSLTLSAALGGSTIPAKVVSIAKLALTTSATAEFAAFAYDVAKVGKQAGLARDIALAWPSVATGFLSEDPVAPLAAAKLPFDWIPTMWANHPLLATFRLANFVYTFTRPLMSTSGSAQLTLGEITVTKPAATPGGAATTTPQFFEPFAESVLAAAPTAARKHNELALITLWALHAVNDIRITMLGKAMEVAKNEIEPIRRLRAARYVHDWLDVIKGKPHEGIADPTQGQPAEVQALLRWVVPAIADAITITMVTWVPALIAYQRSAPLDEAAFQVVPLELVAALREGPEFDGFRQTLDKVRSTVLTVEEEALPERDAYATMVETALALVDAEIKLHDAVLVKAAVKARDAVLTGELWTEAKVDRKLLATHGLALLVAYDVRATLAGYSKVTDATLATKQVDQARKLLERQPDYVAAKPLEQVARLEPYGQAYDYRGQHRRNVAQRLFFHARQLGLGTLADDTKLWAGAVDIGLPIAQLSAAQRANLLIIPGEWESSSEPFSQVFADITQGTLQGLAPLTLRDVYHVTLLDEFLALNKDLGDAMAQGGVYVDAQGKARTDYAPKDDIINLIAGQQEKRPHPKRWLLRSSEYQFNPTDTARREFSELLSAHPKTKMLRLAEIAAGRTYAVWNVQYQTPVVIWTLPDIKTGIQRLRANKTLAAFVDAYRSKPGETPSSSAGMDDYGWLMVLRSALEAQKTKLEAAKAAAAKAEAKPAKPGDAGTPSPTDVVDPAKTPEREAVRTIEEALATDVEFARTLLIGKLREASILTRIYYTESLLRPLIKDSAGPSFSKVSVPKHGEFLRFDIAEKIQQKLWELGARFEPPEDRDAQRAATVASLAPTLRAAWAKSGRYSLIVTWRPLVNEAQKFLSSPSSSPIGKIAGQTTTPSSLDVVQTSEEKAQRASNLADLEAIEKAWAATVKAAMLESGLVGRVGEGAYPRGVLQPAGGGILVPAGKGESSNFVIGGIHYSIKKVHRTFSWFGPYRPTAKLGSRSGGTEPDSDAAMLFTSEDISDASAKVEPYIEDRKAIKLLDYEVDGQARELHGHEDHEIGKLSSALALHGTVQSLQQLADVLEAGAGFAMDAVELIPGVGQAAAAARIATAVFAFLGSDEFDQLMALIRDDPLEFLKGALTKLADRLLTPAGFWQFMLLAQFPLPNLAHPQKDNAVRQNHRAGRLGRILERLKALGVKLGLMFARFQRRVVAFVDRIRLAVLQRPRLARFIGMVGRFIEILRELKLTDIFSDPVGTAKSGLSGLLTTLGTNVRGIFDRLTGFTVPERIIPVAEIFEVVIDILVRRIGGKYKYAVQGFMKLLELTGLKSKIFVAIESKLPKELNPNTYVVEVFKAELETKVQDVSTRLFESFALEVGPRIDALVGSTEFSTALGSAPKISVAAAGDEFAGDDSGDAPEAQPMLFDGVSTIRGPPLERALASSRGLPLATSQRASLERRFGHDLGHVRVHGDAAARSLTRDYSAAALTTGSHVFLGSQVDPRSRGGESVLRHELTHVLQQTGARPLGGAYSSRPMPGRPGPGVVLDAAREATADRVASQTASEGARVAAPRVGAAAGAQPSLLATVVGPTLAAISDPSLLTARAAHIDATQDGEGLTSLDQAQENDLLKVWKLINAGLTKGATIGQVAVAYAKPFDVAEATKAIQGRFVTRETANRQAIGDLGKRSTEPLAAKTQGDDAVPVVRPARFAAELVTYLFASTGILLDIDLDVETATGKFPLAAKPDQPWFKLASPVKAVKIVFINLADVYGGDDLWTLAQKNTWPTDTDEKQQSERRARLRGVLREQKVSSAVWHATEFKFGDAIVAEEKRLETDLLNAGATGRVEASKLPSKAEYLDLKKIESNHEKNIGLRLGHFIQLENYSSKTITLPDTAKTKVETKGQQRGIERESHHTTQYLLLEFFRNAATRDAFPLLKKGAAGNRSDGKAVYPGVESTGGEVDAFAGKVRFPIKEFEDHRGGLMPALLIARVTHRTGGLHITSTSEDFGPSVTTPGSAIQSIFQQRLPAEYLKAEAAAEVPPTTTTTGGTPTGGPAVFQAHVDKVGEAVVKQQIEDAMVASYRWMYHDKMKSALTDALHKQELEYFNELAKAAGRTDALTAADMTAVAEAAIKHNVAIMKIAGFER
jgi:hypothetical protein